MKINKLFMMDKRGVLIEISAIIIVILTTLGVIYTISSSQSLYIGDKGDETYFDYFKCKKLSDKISDENLITFKNEKEAISLGYKSIEGCI